MPILTWNETFDVGVIELNSHHKHLFSLVNQLFDAMRAGKGKDSLGKILTELTSYTVYHFAAEEKLFRTHGYPALGEHKKEHDELTNKVVDFKTKFESGNALISIELMNFLKDWLNNHIMGTDKKYGPFLNSKGII